MKVGTRGTLFDRTRVKRMLANPRYAGLLAHRGEVVGPGAWPAIVSRDMWETVQARLEGPRPRKQQAPPRRYLLTGLAECGRCGTRLVARPNGRRRRYGCPSPRDGGCGRVFVWAEPAEAFAAADALAELADPAVRRALEAGDGNEHERHLAELRAAEAKLENLARLYASDALSEREWLEARGVAVERAEAARRALSATSRTSALARLPVDVEGLADSWNGATFARRRALLEACLERVVIRPGRQGAQAVERDRVEVVLRA